VMDQMIPRTQSKAKKPQMAEISRALDFVVIGDSFAMAP
jgi:hypothetical protein